MIHEEKILEQVERQRDEIVSFLQTLIRAPSITGSEADVQQVVINKLREMDLMVDAWEPDWNELKKHPMYQPVAKGFENRPVVVGKWQGNGNGKSLLLNGHCDVVQPGEGWTRSPWAAEVVNGRVYGRGASDMKGGLAAMIMAVKCLREAGETLNGDVIIESVVDEENGINGSLAALMRGYQADACINGEASDLEIQRAHSGLMEYFLHVYGKATPIVRKDDAISPIEKGYRIVQAMADLESHFRVAQSHPLYPPKSMNVYVTSFHSGIQTTVLPHEAIIGGMIRLLPGMEVKATQQQVEEYITNVAHLDPFMRQCPPAFRWEGLYAESMEVPEDHPIVKCLESTFLYVTGRQAKLSGHEGACDPWIINNYGKIPTVIFGPGKISQMHAVDEFVEISDLIVAVKTLALSIYKWCNQRH